jgi:hypothetical protein
MKKTKFTAILLAATTASFVFTGCGKDDDDSPANPAQETRTDLLTASEWKGDDVMLNGQTKKNDPFYDYIADKSYTFNKNGTYTSMDGGNNNTGVWNFIDNETKIGMYTNASKAIGDTAEIGILTKDQLGLKYTDIISGTTVTLEERFIH